MTAMDASPPTDAEGDLSLRRLLSIGLRWWWFIAACCIFSAGAAAFVTSEQTPIYEGRALLLVNQGQALGALSHQDILGSQQLTETYARLATSRSNYELAHEQLTGVTLDIDTFADKISAHAVRDTQLIEVTAEDPDPDTAAHLANTVANVFPDYVQRAQLAGADTEQQPANTVFVAEHATAPESPVRPNPTLNIALGTALGLMVAIAVVAVREHLDDTIHDRRDLEALGISHLADIPLARERASTFFRWRSKPPSFEAGGGFTEAFRRLYTNLQFVFSASDAKVILVTSAHAADGKTLVSFNLGRALAESSQNVLLIDGDLRRPSLHETASVPNGAGLSSTFLIGAANAASSVCQVDERLFVLPAGPLPPNPSALLGSDAMRSIIDEVRTRFDRIIIDSPPLEGVSDASVLMNVVDGVVIVANRNATRREHLIDAVQQVRRSGKSLLGVVINRAEQRRADRYYYSYSQAREPVVDT